MKITRRKFVKSGIAAGVAARIGTGLAAPLILHAEDKSGSRAPILGSGEWTFEWIGDWGQLPSNIKWGNTHNVAEDAHGNIYVHHTVYADSESPDSMVVFDHKGKFIRSWGKEFKGVAHGMWLNKEGKEEFLYLTVNAANPKLHLDPGELPATVLKATLKGEIVWKVQGPPDIDAYHSIAGASSPPPYNPTNIAIAPNGDLYVADGYGSYYVNHYNHQGEYLNTFGGRGSDPGQFKEPHGIWVDTRTADPVLIVADRRNNRLQRLTLGGKPIDFVTGFRLPCHFHEQKGNVVIPDLQTRVTLMDKSNNIILHLGDPAAGGPANPPRNTSVRASFVPGQFVCPHGACFDHQGNIFVVEWVEMGRVTKLRKVA
jgi:hypothetical protein